MADSRPPPSSFEQDPEFLNESIFQFLGRRIREEPLIPIGCAFTCWALVEAAKSVRSGDRNRTNRMFRRRIYAQGFTVVAMLVGSLYWSQDREKRAKYDKKLKEQIALEKREAWIKELEYRDQEEQEMQRRRQAPKARVAQAAAAGVDYTVPESTPDASPPGVVAAVQELTKKG
ncbi:MAG: Respiratory supercomplex factor 1, mitochondrial [Watsoniomyces obsoletus]|nr:MAG: Respiratory supercomplex factor 1, mitochondrial [Watsoniomyces obsoletus]